MFRFIAKVLIVSLLTLNIAWADDECAFALSGDNSYLPVQTGDESPDKSLETDFDCDDWCHVWANPIALLGAIVLNNHIPITTGTNRYIFSYSSLTIPPPFHPPII